ncbi:hypothetical protein KDK_77120 [Dictyobacter kobayashii]|uniref:Uncharacterized protein n=1 Tax=Dictyobacter kobayashii TaxID=2014872 RepID=A0A402AXR8_9CHLR|nr:hypothetical protein KDK_77120 [Dictyobacter kobayashii]
MGTKYKSIDNMDEAFLCEEYTQKSLQKYRNGKRNHIITALILPQLPARASNAYNQSQYIHRKVDIMILIKIVLLSYINSRYK